MAQGNVSVRGGLRYYWAPSRTMYIIHSTNIACILAFITKTGKQEAGAKSPEHISFVLFMSLGSYFLNFLACQ